MTPRAALSARARAAQRAAPSRLLLGLILAAWSLAALPALGGESIVRIPPGKPSTPLEPSTPARAPDPPPPPPPQQKTSPTPSNPPSPPPGATGPGNYGAIAYSPSSGAMGWGFDFPSKDEAEKTAMTNCRKYATDCVVPVWFRNACGAVATGPSGYGSGWGTNKQLAESYALDSCRNHSKNCVVQRTVCSTGVR